MRGKEWVQYKVAQNIEYVVLHIGQSKYHRALGSCDWDTVEAADMIR